MKPLPRASRTQRRRFAPVVALILAACTAGGGNASSSVALAPKALSGFTIEQPKWGSDPSTWSVVLTWNAPADAFVVDHYLVTRDGGTIGAAVKMSTFHDKTVAPGTRYRYTVVAVDAAGKRTPASIASIRTRTPKVADARLSGRFLTSMQVTSSTVGASGTVTVFWVFSPTCSQGACRARLTVEGHGPLGILSRAGSTYTGTLSAPFLIRSCHGAHIPETLVVSIRVRHARVVGRAWRATSFSGTFAETAGAAGCLVGRNSYAVHGKAGA
jgi:hypothetical protein